MTVARAYQSLDAAAEKLCAARDELNKSQINRQLLARHVVSLTDEVRGFREERDEAESKVVELTDVIEDLKGALQKMAAEMQTVRAALATAQASVSWQQSRLP